ncbi:MAG TPA: CsbD family protein [Methylomirabilota bacterium]|nr:CsbD family protein [Methylomirabilota bacterium]
MDKDRIEGGLKEAGGKAKEGWGDLTDDPETEAEGQADQVEGKVQSTWGEGKDKVRDLADDDR